MKSARIITSILAVAMIFSCLSLASCKSDDKGEEGEKEVKFGKYIYVSESGDDANSGEESSPVRTLAGAVEILRKIKAEGLPEGGVCVTFASGNYPVTSTVTFTESDSGEADKPIVFKGEEGAIINGGVDVPAENFSPVSEDAKARLNSDDAKANVLEADISALGITDYGDERTVNGYSIELFCDYARQTVARYPNDGEYVYGNHIEICDGFIRQSLPEDRAEAWANSSTIRYYGYPVYDWSNHRAYSDNLRINIELGMIEVLGLSTVRTGQPYYVYNLLEELDAPGEYYIDPDEQKLYYYPDGDIAGKKISLTNYAGNFIEIGDVSYLTFDGLTFENARGNVFYYVEADEVPLADHITVENCLIRDVSLQAVHMCGTDFKVLNCEMYELGCGGVKLGIDNRNTLIPANSSIENCYIHDFSRVYTVYQPAISLSGYGYYCAHNELCGSTHEAIAFCGGSLFEYNYIHDVCSETSDAGAIYAGRRLDQRRCIFRYNIIENVIDHAHGGAPNGIYCDDCLAETICYGNILNNIAGNAFAMGGGKDSKVYNNIIINCNGTPVNYDERGIGWAGATLSYPTGDMWQTLSETDFRGSALLRYSFPRNLLMIETSSSNRNYVDMPGVPSYTYICRNVAISCRNEDTVKTAVGVEMLVSAASSVREYGTIIDNVAYSENPGIKDIEGGDYTIAEDSPIWRDVIGFESIPVEEIGLLK